MSIKFALLSLLAEQPASVGQLKSTFEQRTHDTWPVNVGQVYQTVQRLLRDGLVEITTDSSGTAPGSGPSGRQPGRHTEVFVPTADGLAELNHWWREPILPHRMTATIWSSRPPWPQLPHPAPCQLG